MSILIVCERRAQRAYAIDEREVAHRWWSLPLPSLLPISSGATYRLLYAGRPGGPMGPDVHDAVFSVLATGEQLVGDVEFHITSSEWRQHQHQDDPRYNQVILHVVLVCNDARPTLRQDGTPVPVCSLYDLPAPAPPVFAETLQTPWPCQQRLPLLHSEARNTLLRDAGLLRFEQKAHALLEQLHTTLRSEGSSTYTYDYDACLFVALAEALGYGRDRAFFRAVGRLLLGHTTAIPEPLARTAEPSPLDTRRLRVLRSLRQALPNLWPTLRTHLLAATTADTTGRDRWIASGRDKSVPTPALRAFFVKHGVSQARTDILLCNVVLPFAAAVALLEGDGTLAEAATAAYMQHPGLPSNAITRMMARQLHLEREPIGSCQQQGLHYIYQQTCRAKLCAVCIAGRSVL